MIKPELTYLLNIELGGLQLPEHPENDAIVVEANIGLEGEVR